MKKLYFILTSLFFTYIFCSSQPTLSLQEFSTGFQKPVAIAHANDERLFVVESKGEIWELDENGIRDSDVFLDIQDKVNNGGNEQGLLGLAFPPNFDINQTFYVYYTGGTGSGFSVIARYKLDPITLKGDQDTEEILLTFNQPFANHNGGDMHFGRDGFLYISTGDGGSANDPLDKAQNPKSILGKILRIDVNSSTGYSIPSDNPYLNDDSGSDEVWALGLRNPWRFSFDRLKGDMWIGDVGQGSFEEIDHLSYPLEAGVNFGWRCYEANSAFNVFQCGPRQNYTFPIFEYSRTLGFSVTGGFVYRGGSEKHFQGNYLTADYISGNFWAISPKSDTFFVHEYDNFLRDVSTFGENLAGELFVAELGTGKIYRINAECENDSLSKPEIASSSSPDRLIASNVDNRTENYQWYLNDEIISGAEGAEYEITEDGDYKVETIFNNSGCIYRSTSEDESVVVGIGKHESDVSLKIYPNPSSTSVFIESEQQIISLQVYTIRGEMLQPEIEIKNRNSAEIRMMGYDKGIYIMRVQLDKSTFYKRFIKH